MWTDLGISVLNGMFGDYLRDRGNGLAIDMAFYHRNRPLPLTAESLYQAHPHPTTKLCILLHGLGCNEGVWAFRDATQRYPETSYGTLLQKEFGYTPFYVRYNTGLPIAENGKGLAALLDELLACYPVGIAEIVLIGHSMGGLVLRSACHYGTQRQSPWVGKVGQAFYLGTPHNGADLEKLGHVATAVLHAVPNPITRLIGTILNQRSQGVKDLRSGRLLDDAPDTLGPNGEPAVPWLASAHHYLIVGTLTRDSQHVAARLFGDALVRPPQDNTFKPGANVKLFRRMHHLKLAHDPRVYRQIKRWCGSDLKRS